MENEYRSGIKNYPDIKGENSVEREKLEIFQSRTLEKIYNRLCRYRKKLILEGINEVKDKNLDLKIREDKKIRLINGNPTIWVGKNETDISNLLNLSKKRVPSLYRRYYLYLDKMEKILDY